jgi:hypothetical protein
MYANGNWNVAALHDITDALFAIQSTFAVAAQRSAGETKHMLEVQCLLTAAAGFIILHKVGLLSYQQATQCISSVAQQAISGMPFQFRQKNGDKITIDEKTVEIALTPSGEFGVWYIRNFLEHKPISSFDEIAACEDSQKVHDFLSEIQYQFTCAHSHSTNRVARPVARRIDYLYRFAVNIWLSFQKQEDTSNYASYLKGLLEEAFSDYLVIE